MSGVVPGRSSEVNVTDQTEPVIVSDDYETDINFVVFQSILWDATLWEMSDKIAAQTGVDASYLREILKNRYRSGKEIEFEVEPLDMPAFSAVFHILGVDGSRIWGTVVSHDRTPKRVLRHTAREVANQGILAMIDTEHFDSLATLELDGTDVSLTVVSTAAQDDSPGMPNYLLKELGITEENITDFEID